MNDFRASLEAELDAEFRVPATGLVTGAVTRGRRMIRTRRLGVAATFALVALVLGAVAWSVPRRPEPADTGRTDLPANAATLATALRSRLPAGVTLTAAYRYENDPPAVAVYLDRGVGPGLMQFAVDNYPRTAETCVGTDDRDTDCRYGPDGSLAVITTSPGNCQEHTVVERFRSDGVHVSVFLATCLRWDGTSHPPAAQPLTVDEALTLSNDPVWAMRMDGALVSDATTRLPDLPEWADE